MPDPRVETSPRSRAEGLRKIFRRRKPVIVRKSSRDEDEREPSSDSEEHDKELRRQTRDRLNRETDFDDGDVQQHEDYEEGETEIRQLDERIEPPDDLQNGKILDLLRIFNDQIDGHQKLTSRHIELLRQQVVDALNDITQYAGATDDEKQRARNAERGRVNDTVLSDLGRILLKKAREEGLQPDSRDFLAGVTIPEDGDRLATTEDLLVNQGARDEAYNQIFASVDSKPDQFFNEAFDVLTDGLKYNEFMNLIRGAGNHPTRIQDSVARQYIAGLSERRLDQLDQRARRAQLGEENVEARILMQAKIEIAATLLEDYNRYSKERKIRELLHNAGALTEITRVSGEQIYGYIEQTSSRIVDYAHRIPGVKEMMDIYEAELRQIMYENEGYLPPEEVSGAARRKIDDENNVKTLAPAPRAERDSKEVFRKMVKSGQILLRSDDVGGRSVTKTDFKDWEVDRVFSTARAMMLLSQRLLSLASESTMPKTQGAGKYNSLFMQDAIQSYNTTWHLMMKYGVPNPKALAAMYTEPDREKMLFGKVRKPWFINDVMGVKHAMEDSGDINGLMMGKYGEKLQIRRQSPAFIGDIWTFVGWRAHENRTIVSGAQEFLENGYRRMKIQTGNAGAEDVLKGMTAKEIAEYSTQLPVSTQMREIYESLEPDQKEAYLNEYANWRGTGLRFEFLRESMMEDNTDERKREAARDKGKKLLHRIVELQPGRIFLKSHKIQKRMSGTIEHIRSAHAEEHKQAELAAFGEGNERYVSEGLMMSRIQENLLFLEREMYNSRDELLREGYTFDGEIGRKFTLRTIAERLSQKRQRKEAEIREAVRGDVNIADDQKEQEIERRLGEELPRLGLPNAGYEAATWEFVDAMQGDFASYADHHGEWHEHGGHRDFKYEDEGYFQEFIENREYNHAYTLWSGDAPVDEFNMGATGASGAFARRAGENKDTGEGNKLMVGFLGEMNNFQSPDEIYNALTAIYTKVKDYDMSMAKRMVTYLAEAACKMYGATGPANAPLGDLFVDRYWFPRWLDGVGKLAGKFPGGEKVQKKLMSWGDMTTGSLAQRLWDNPRAMVWHPTDSRYLIEDLLFRHGKITPEQKNELINHTTARSWDVLFDKANTIGPLLAIAMTIYIMKKASEDV